MTTPRRGRPPPDAGFTLLEILVALVVLGFIMTGLAQGVRFGLRAWDTQTRIIDERGELDAVDRVVRRLVERMEPGRDREPARVQGTANSLAFTSELPIAAAAIARQADVAILVSGGRLLLRWTPHSRVQRLGPPPPPAEEELLSGVNRVEFSYWGPAGVWTSAWTEQTLPALVRMRVVFPEGDRRRWPDIVAAPLRDRIGGA